MRMNRRQLATLSPPDDTRRHDDAHDDAHRHAGDESDSLPNVDGSIRDAGSARSVAARLPHRHLILATLLASLGLVAWWMGAHHPALVQSLSTTLERVLGSELFWLAVAVGLAAQIVDGALGMAYGVTSNTFLIGLGATPAAASASVHIAEIFTTAFSGASHLRFGHVDRALFMKIVVPGVLSGLLGVAVLTSIDSDWIKPWIAAYLFIMGLVILRKALVVRQTRRTDQLVHVRKLAAAGGFLDAVGGGGWGPVVSSSLIGQGHCPRRTIGTVNTAEFFVALATGLGFLLAGGLNHGILVAGLIVGGLFAAPFSAWLVSRVPVKLLMIAVGLLVSGLSLTTLLKALG